MQCENGYTKDGVRGILCRKAEEPKIGDMRSTAHALCGNQRFCPTQRCYQMLPGWEKCPLREKKMTDCHVAGAPRNDSSEEKPVEAAETEISAEPQKSTPKRKRSQKAK